MTFLREQLHRSPRALAITLGVALIAYGVWDGGSFWITYTLVSYGVVFIVIAVLQPHRLGRDWRDRRPPDQKLMDAFRFLVCWRRWLIVGALILVAADIAILDYVARRGTEEMAKLIPTPGTAGGTLHRWEAVPIYLLAAISGRTFGAFEVILVLHLAVAGWLIFGLRGISALVAHDDGLATRHGERES